jgi:ribosomal protein S6
MARPSTIKVGMNGEVIMKNLTKEQQQAVADALAPKEEAQETVSAETQSVTVDEATLSNIALGVNKNKDGHYELVTVKYDSESKQAVVESVKVIKERNIAIGEFKFQAVELGIY